MDSTKRQKIEDNIEKKELKAYLDLVPREEFAIEIESLGTKYPIVDWKTHVLKENFTYYQIIRANGGSKNYKIFSEMLDDFDRHDVMDLHRLVEERYATSRPEGYDLMLWGDIKILFQPDEEDEVLRHQHEYNLISWRLFDSCGIHILLMDNGIAIHMMIEKKYPLTQEMLSKMLSRKLEVDHENEMAFELLRLSFHWISFDYRVTLGFDSIAGGLDHVNPVIRLPLEHRINRVLGKDDHSNPRMSNAGQPETTVNEYMTKVMLMAFHFTLKGRAKQWMKQLSTGSITTWDLFKNAFLSKYRPLSQIIKQINSIRNFEQESNEPLHLAWERFSDSLYNCPEHKINKHEQLQIFYQGLDTETRRKVDFKGPIPRMTPTAGMEAIIELSKHSLSWYEEGDFKNNNLNVVFKQINNFEQNVNDITEEV
ncbi:putative reverse transcriptase domain-containing protein [Tanacetum coccineum]